MSWPLVSSLLINSLLSISINIPTKFEFSFSSLVDDIYNNIKQSGKKVTSETIGETVLEHLKKENEVAYLRFASVYKEFSNISDFEKEAAEFT